MSGAGDPIDTLLGQQAQLQTAPSVTQTLPGLVNSPGADPIDLALSAQANAKAPPAAAPQSQTLPVNFPQWARDAQMFDPSQGYIGAAGATMLQGPTLGYGADMEGGLASLFHNFIPWVEGRPTNWRKDYQDVSTAYKNAAANFTSAHPGRAIVGQTLASLPGTTYAAGEALAERAPSFFTNVARGMTLGGTVGGVAGSSNGDTLTDRFGNAMSGAEFGALVGGATVPVAYVAGSTASKLGQYLLGSPRSPNPTVSDMLLDNLTGDKIIPSTAADTLRTDPTGQLTLADIGGENSKTQRLARALVTMPGPASKQITNFMNERDAGQTGRVLGSISDSLADAGDIYVLGDQLQTAKQAAARPLYEAAGVPSDPAQYGQAPLVENKDVELLLRKSKDVRSAIAQARALPDYADLPDNSMVLLDKAYKNIGGSAYEAKVAGNGERARDLNSLRGSLLDAITQGDPSHPYQQALNAYSGAADTQNALALGQQGFGADARQVARTYSNLSDGDKQFYQIGFADALQKKLNAAADSRDAVKVIYGNNNIRSSIASVFGPDAADSFDAAMQSERAMNQTSNYLTGGSQTANKLGDVVKPTLLKKVLGDAVQGGVAGFMGGGLHGAAVGAVGLPLANAGKDIASALVSRSVISNPTNAAELGRLLTTPGEVGASQLERYLGPQAARRAATARRNVAIGRALTATGPVSGVIGGQLSNEQQGR